jgi:hypothetical protein
MSVRSCVTAMALGFGLVLSAPGAAHADAPPANFCTAAASVATALQKPTTAVQPAKAKAVVKSLNANAGAMPSALKATIQQLDSYLAKVAAAGSSIKKLGDATRNSAKYNSAAPKFVKYYDANC